MRPWSMILSAIAVALGTASFVQSANAQYYRRTSIIDGRNGDVAVVRHTIDCNCGPRVRTYRAGTFTYVVPRPPVVDYGMVLPIYQPPLYTFPRQVVPAYPVYPRSGAYPVTSPRQQQALLPVRPWYPTGTDARVIGLDEMPPAEAPRPRRRR
ncbi:hypothetical protein [Phreatobacter stygius]|uniref:Uncharacterized protein n=1 Tax=Phreatobacter stygius TaxID=1940610 RepID=A0A4D7BG36_9HYPH|nr:hypothetical protein [Phreatobacter stygius]QCI68136.1 hypothetical protein E8M01_30235 [Phreatobacter stygius]